MPSWNIHTAHVERLLAEYNQEELGIHDVNCFLFGNLVPDIYVGYMVAHTTRTIPYGATHLTDPTFMPLPDADLFWDSYVVSRPGLQEATDLTLGAWAHLVADRCYNGAVRRVIANKDLPHGDELRIRKQADFDAFGRMLTITSVPHETDELLRQAQAFPQYPLAQSDVLAALDAAKTIVDKNREEHLAEEPDWNLLDAAFFAQTFEETHQAIATQLQKRAQGLL